MLTLAKWVRSMRKLRGAAVVPLCMEAVERAGPVMGRFVGGVDFAEYARGVIELHQSADARTLFGIGSTDMTVGDLRLLSLAATECPE